jgi:hypothetical protein
MEGSGHAKFKVLSQNLHEGAEENTKNQSQQWSAGQDLNLQSEGVITTRKPCSM